MDDDLRKLLESWGVGEQHIQHLNDEDIHSIDLMLLMEEGMVSNVFKTMGSLLHFKRKLKEYKQLKAIEENNEVNVGPSSAPHASGSLESFAAASSDRTAPTTPDHASTSPQHDAPTEAEPRASTSSGNGVLTATPQSRKRAFDPSDIIEDLNDLLQSKSGLAGRVILSHFKQRKELNEEMRDSLADIILNEVLKDDYRRKISYEVELSIASQIISCFPTEPKDIWVSPFAQNRQKALGRGKLLTRYYAKRRKLGKSSLLADDTDITDPDEANEAVSLEDNNDLLWLRNNKQPWSDVTDHWKATSKLRLRHLISGSQEINEYMDLYPALSDNSGFLLFEIDFESLFNARSLSLYAEWPTLSSFIESKVPATVLKDIEASLTPEGRKVRTLLALPYLCNVVTVAKKKSKQWRPSRTEVGEAMLFQAKNQLMEGSQMSYFSKFNFGRAGPHTRAPRMPRTSAKVKRGKAVGDIEGGLDLRFKSKYEPFGLPCGPQAIAVGADPDSITQSYVRVNKILYQVENPIKAVDIAFKAMHALDAKYHEEAKREWLFLERAVYRVNLDKVTVALKIRALLDEYNRFKENA